MGKLEPDMRRGGRPGVFDEKGMLIRFGLYNIWNGINGSTESDSRRTAQAIMDLGIF